MNSKHLIIGCILVLCIGGISYGVYEFNRKPATAAEKTSDLIVSAEELGDAFEKNEKEAMTLYNDKVIEVKGKINSITKNGNVFDIALETNDPMTNVNVNLIEEMNAKINTVHEGDVVTLKGFCTGKIMDIELNKGIIK